MHGRSTPPHPVEDLIREFGRSGWRERVERCFPDSDVPELFDTAMRRTLTDTLHPQEDGSVFVITGDIPAMWLRDSSAQLWPYLPLAAENPGGPIADTVAGVLRRQFAFIVQDPYANAFNAEPSSRAHSKADLDRDPWVWERKYEIDSLCLPVQLAHDVWRLTGRTDMLHDGFLDAADAILATLDRERDHERDSNYRFVRPGAPPLDTLARDGRGTPVAVTGLTWSGFRPSDDACELGYNIPANLLACRALDQLAELLDVVGAAARASTARTLSTGIRDAVDVHGVVDHERFGRIYAYEVDGLGNHVLMDDANLPSLLGLPMFSDIERTDPLYARTRSFLLSGENPQYWSGSAASGIGSPHTWPRFVWPIALAVEGLTSGSSERARELAELIAATTAATGHVHESFDVDDPTRFTRPWFSWADSMFALLVMQVCGWDGLSTDHAGG